MIRSLKRVHDWRNALWSATRVWRRSIETKSVREVLESGEALRDSKVRVVGWIKSTRDQKEIKFAHLVDGSDSRQLQLVFLSPSSSSSSSESSLSEQFDALTFNTAIECEGVVVVVSDDNRRRQQSVELRVTDLSVVGACDPTSYPFKARAKYSLEQLRQHVHLRSHVALFAELMRARSRLTHYIHDYFDRHAFTQIHTPIITSNNCEGGCETFQVASNEKDDGLAKLAAAEFKKKKKNENKVKNKNDGRLEDEEEEACSDKYFFSRPAYLTASAQLHLEAMTSTLGNVYTLSPAFRAEKSLTRHHLAEFYMLEAELVDMRTLGQLMDVAEDFLRQVAHNTLKNLLASRQASSTSGNSSRDGSRQFYSSETFKSLVEMFEDRTKRFERVKYEQAIEILNKNNNNNNNTATSAKSMQKQTGARKRIEFGEDFNKEQEKLLVEHFGGKTPVFVTHYPRAIKPFYMRQCDQDPRLVENFDLLVPRVGEIIGGSLREYRLDLLVEAMKRQNLITDAANNNSNDNNYSLYLETKKYAGMRLGGFGLGLERLVQFLFDVENIRDTCAFPRALYTCKM